MKNRGKISFGKTAVLLAVLVFATGLGGCEKTETTSCTYRIIPSLQQVKGGTITPVFDNVVVYGYMVDKADTLLWHVESYENALQGILSSVSGGQTRQPDFTGNIEVDVAEMIYRVINGLDLKSTAENYTFYDYANLQMGPVEPGELMIVACDLDGHGLDSKIYAWRGMTVVSGIEYVSMQLKFCPWEQRSRYIDSKWVMANDNPYVPPVVTEEPEEPDDPDNPNNPDDSGGDEDEV